MRALPFLFIQIEIETIFSIPALLHILRDSSISNNLLHQAGFIRNYHASHIKTYNLCILISSVPIDFHTP